MTTVCIHQPDFAPWLGFFERLTHCDLYVVLDNVQFLRRGWHHRDKIKTAAGVQWLTVPTRNKGRHSQLIADTAIDDGQDWRRRHLRTLEVAYARAPHLAAGLDLIRPCYEAGHALLPDFTEVLIRRLLTAFGIEVEIVRASTLGVTGGNNELLIAILEAVGGDVYLSGLGARAYLDEAAFAARGIRVVWQDFAHPIYPQRHGPFVPGLSSLDALFNCGPGLPALLTRQQFG